MTLPILVIGNKNYSSWSLRPWLALKQAGIAFEEIRIPLDTPTTKADILKYSPTGKVPVFITGTTTIWDSLAIGEYVAEQAPHLWPNDPYVRAVARSVSAEMHSGFPHLRQHLSMDIRARYQKTFSSAVQADIDRVQQIWESCRQAYGAQGDFLFGDFSLADAMYAPVVMRFITYGVPQSAVCEAYSQAILALPAMQDWITAATLEVEDLPNHQ
jgi:glutathione S-transferase